MELPIAISKISSRGQIVIPKNVREKLSLDVGDYVTVEVRDDSIILRHLPLEHMRDETGLRVG
ncbi:MAG TPA: AbrB/MazE/SpoVT family DNA-binding domain-containing protein [Firmicutes bacterium]|jgi:AbrB family looped-hinge helix DNA binding protein|nr:AbrB/MazE/SpoVT family DNA-binding domain-containing protein [Bacillota bacterium]